jgi:hypothetical protein
MVLVVIAVPIQSRYWSFDVTVFIYHKGTSMYDNLNNNKVKGAIKHYAMKKYGGVDV